MGKLIMEEWPIDKLYGYARNPRKNDAVIDRMKSSIAEFGFKIPILARSSGEIVDGHLRWKAAKAMGMETVPVTLADDLTDTQVKAFRLLANQSANWAAWDEDLLKLELEDLKLEDFDISMIGFDDAVMPDELPPYDEEAADAVPEVQEQAVSRQGDIWLLGDHRLMCGDSTDAGNVVLLMENKKADLLLTDPPYGVSIVKSNGCTNNGNKPFTRKGTTWGKYDKAILSATEYHPIIGDNSTETAQKSYEIAKSVSDIQVIFGGNYFTGFLPPSRCWFVWDKGLPDGFSFAQCELAWVSKDGSVRMFHRLWSGLCREGDRKTEGIKRIHPTQKPVSLCCDIIKEFDCNTVLDLFGGSGSTLIACEQLGKTCYCMEMADYYVDVIIRRWQDLTGKAAILEGDGRTFEEIADERG